MRKIIFLCTLFLVTQANAEYYLVVPDDERLFDSQISQDRNHAYYRSATPRAAIFNYNPDLTTGDDDPMQEPDMNAQY